MFSGDRNDPLALKKIRRDDNCHRVYTMRRTTSLFGEPAITVVWGRIGAAKVRVETFPTAEEREERWAELVARRARHGYGLAE